MQNIFSMIPSARKVVPALLAAAFLLPLPAYSEIKAGSVEVSPFIGYNIFENKQNLKDRPLIGGRIGYNFTDRFGIEGAVEYMKSHVDDEDKNQTREGQFASPIGSVKITSYHLDFLYHFMPESNFNPFIVAGYGATHYSPDINTKNMSAINYGVGAKYWVADNIALRLDLRDNMVTEVFQETYHNVSANLGVVFRFGGQSHSEPVAKHEPEPQPVVKAEEKVVILASEPQAEEKILVAAKEPKVIILALEDIHFDFDQSTLKPEAKTILKRNIQLLKDNPKAKVRIAGYTSAQGTEDYNQQLSERRAEAVEAYLVEEGVIVADRLSTIGYGDRRPAVHEAAPAEIYSPAAKANMRVLFEIIVK
ncbi:MAG: outer membrane beta-barrel domain-containing protein [Desulfuromonadales bacterium]|nr:outer membrane beta-barrel domain-containing protein [Desulfuromonadales bacterium]